MVSTILVFSTALLIVLFGIPSIITVAKLKGLYDKPNNRKLHTNKIPRLGGLAMFAAFAISVSLWSTPDVPHLQYLTAGLVVLFFSGLKDDIIVLSPVNKLVMQLFASGLVSMAQDIRIDNFQGLFGVYEIPFAASVALTIFTIIVITNAFNLIDGVDGLAGGLSFIITGTYAIWFNAIGETGWALLAFGLAGAILGFLFFNFSPAKIFMGDAGSLTIGFLISIFTLKFLDFSTQVRVEDLNVKAAPAIAVAILIVPLYDTLRIFIVRIMQRKSPFKADRNHIHHWLLKIGLNHKMVCYVLCTINVLFVLMAYTLRSNNVLLVMSLVVGLACIIGQLPMYIYRHKITDLDVDETKIFDFEIDEKITYKEFKN